jgi:hypothetical protein
VILCTDGDFNVGASSDQDMETLIEQERKSGVFLTVLGYGMGNYQDAKMQKLADKGNGNHAYIDGITEAKKVLVNEFGGTSIYDCQRCKTSNRIQSGQSTGVPIDRAMRTGCWPKKILIMIKKMRVNWAVVIR